MILKVIPWFSGNYHDSHDSQAIVMILEMILLRFLVIAVCKDSYVIQL